MRDLVENVRAFDTISDELKHTFNNFFIEARNLEYYEKKAISKTAEKYCQKFIGKAYSDGEHYIYVYGFADTRFKKDEYNAINTGELNVLRFSENNDSLPEEDTEDTTIYYTLIDSSLNTNRTSAPYREIPVKEFMKKFSEKNNRYLDYVINKAAAEKRQFEEKA